MEELFCKRVKKYNKTYEEDENRKETKTFVILNVFIKYNEKNKLNTFMLKKTMNKF